MANTSPSGLGTNLTLTLSGKGADLSAMPCMPEVSEEETSVVPDTGFFPSTETGSASPFVVGGAFVLGLALVATLSLLLVQKTARKTARPSFSKVSGKKSFEIKNPKLVAKRLGIFTGLFLFAFLALGIVAPNFLDESDSASALDTTGALAVTTGSANNNHALNMFATISDTPTMAIAQESVSINTATSAGYTLYLSTNSKKESALYLNENACSGYILPTTKSKASLEVNHWGFAVDTTTDAALDNAAIWSAVPKYGNEIAIKRVSTATSAGDTTNVFYGAYIKNTIPAGNYKTTLLYTAIANV